MKRNNKKGFTIVELVIVIAVIAILAAVLIPTFSSIIKKAKVNNDIQLVRNLNTALATDTKEHKTMQDALDAAFEFGYDVAKINNTSVDENKILWDSVNDVFCYLKDGALEYVPNSATTVLAVNDYRLWTISDTVDGTYSTYLYNYEVTETSKKISALKGLDVGKTEGITEIEYVNDTAQEVVIRTNGGTLKINAPSGVVKHYGDSLGVNIIEIAPASYHEHGTVLGNIEIAKGRIEVANGAKVGTILVSSAATGDVKVDVVSGAEIGTVAPTTESAKQDINASSTIPAESKQEEVVNTEVTSLFAGGLGTEASPYLIANEEQFFNINSCSSIAHYYKQINDVTLTAIKTTNIQGVYDGNGYALTSQKFGNKNYTTLFNDITGHTTFKNMNITMGNGAVVLLSCVDWGTNYGADFENITFSSTSNFVEVTVGNFGFVVINALYTDGANTVVYNFKNITNNVNLINNGTCTGVFVGSGPCFNAKTVLNYENCVNNGDITGTESVGYLYGNSSYIESVAESSSEINVKNCKNYGVLSSVNDTAIVTVAPKYDALNTNEYLSAIGGSYVSSNYLKNAEFTLHQTGTAFTIATSDSSVNYKLVLNISSIFYTIDGSAWTENHTTAVAEKNSEMYNVSNGVKYLIDLNIDNVTTGSINNFYAYDKKTAEANGINTSGLTFNSDGYAIVTKDGVNYIIFNYGNDCHIDSSVSILVYAYNSNGTLVGLKKV